MNNRSIIITGASGFIGNYLVRYFSEKGWSVKAFVRTLPDTGILNVDYYVYDLAEPPSEQVFVGTNFLVHAAYQHKSKLNGPAENNIRGTASILELCRKHSVKFLFISSFSAFAGAASDYGKIKLACEKLCDPSIDLILNPGLVLGNGGLFGNIAKTIRQTRLFPLIGNGKQPLQTILLSDLAQVIHTGLLENISGQFHIAEITAPTYRSFVKEVAKHLHKKIFFVYIPARLLLYLTLSFEKLGITLRVNSDNVIGLKSLRSYDTAEDLEVFHIAPKNYIESLSILFF